MAALQNDKMDSKTSSDTDDIPEKGCSPASDKDLKGEDDYENLKYPEPWKFEKWFLGGYSQRRTIKFKSPKTMYKAIPLFAGVVIMFYGYD
ncbi:MAG: hypothetical protein Q9226_007591 [Calogaya cf. arnoldii]